MAEMLAWLIQLTRMPAGVIWPTPHSKLFDFDWDSLAFEKEPIIEGHASWYFTYTEFFGEFRLPTAEETRAFIAEYEAARGKPFTYQEHQTLNAAKVYGLAYSARCEHALHPNQTTYPQGSSRSLLTQYR